MSPERSSPKKTLGRIDARQRHNAGRNVRKAEDEIRCVEAAHRAAGEDRLQSLPAIRSCSRVANFRQRLVAYVTEICLVPRDAAAVFPALVEEGLAIDAVDCKKLDTAGVDQFAQRADAALILKLVEGSPRRRKHDHRAAGKPVALVFHVAAKLAAPCLVIRNVHLCLFLNIPDRLAQRGDPST